MVKDRTYDLYPHGQNCDIAIKKFMYFSAKSRDLSQARTGGFGWYWDSCAARSRTESQLR